MEEDDQVEVEVDLEIAAGEDAVPLHARVVLRQPRDWKTMFMLSVQPNRQAIMLQSQGSYSIISESKATKCTSWSMHWKKRSL